jgi:translation initiation factor 2 subunit 2
MQELYTTEFCLNRVYEKLENGRIDSNKFKVKKAKMIVRDKKTFIINFAELCLAFRRDENTVKAFIDKYLQEKTSINENNVLIINNMYKQKQIDDMFIEYMKTYVICQQQKCGSGNTELVREDRLLYLKCNTCNSKKSIK